MFKACSQKLFLMPAVLGFTLLIHGLYIPAKAALAQLLMQRAWVQTKQQQVIIKPWPWADTQPVARLIIPKLAQNYIVLDGSTGSSLAFGPGHLSGSAQPDKPGHIVISAHRDTHFANIAELMVGDKLQIETKSGKIRDFQIYQLRIVNTEHESLWLDHGSNQLTLITCYPFDAIEAGGPLRYRIDAINSP